MYTVCLYIVFYTRRNFTGPQRAIDLRGSSIKNVTKGGINSPPFEIDEDSHSK